MATVNGIATRKTAGVANAAPSTLGVMIGSQSVQQRFEKMLGKKSAGFLSSLLTLTNNNRLLATANPKTILAAAATAASLDLPINPSLGKAWIVPYKGAAQFQIGYKGVIELAMRSGKMKSIVMTPVYEGEIEDWNRFTETYTAGVKKSDMVVGYFARFETINGFSKATYWTKEEVEAHAKRFSKAYNSGPWKSDFDKMACKTVLLSIMKTYAPMSIEMQEALESDGKVATINETTGEAEYIDVDANDVENASHELADGRAVDTVSGEIHEAEAQGVPMPDSMFEQ